MCCSEKCALSDFRRWCRWIKFSVVSIIYCRQFCAGTRATSAEPPSARGVRGGAQSSPARSPSRCSTACFSGTVVPAAAGPGFCPACISRRCSGPHLPRHARPATAQTRRGTTRSSPIAHPEMGALLASVGCAGPPYVRLVARTKPRYSAITFDRVRKSLSENSPAPTPRSMLWRRFRQRRPHCSAAQGPLGHVPARMAFARRRRFFLLVRQRRPLRVARRRTEVRNHQRIEHAHSVPQHTDHQTWSLPVAGGLQWAPRGATPGGSPSLVPVLQARADILVPWRLVPWPSAGRESVHS